ncbi:MAG: hypothetical protein PHY23_07785 [Oscillospiraceae bacterium]|nr:hypothetical protein [Oscillospiraceae bacterium]
MRGMCFSALDLAAILSGMELGSRAESEFLDRIWDNERAFLAPEYRCNRRMLILDMMYWTHYFSDKMALDNEFPAIAKDFEHISGEFRREAYFYDGYDLDLFFKNARLRILYGGKQDYIRLKLRTLLKEYGYKRRSNQLIERISRCMYFYHIEATLRGSTPCRIDEIGIDEMLTFRVV